jgi:LmbE family N-acetylglucosaminyl deacetylase
MKGLRLMAVLAHPDGAALAADGPLAGYAAQGAQTFLVLATLGEGELGRVRRATLDAGVRETFLLGLGDRRLDEVDPWLIVQRLVEHIRLVRPEMVVVASVSARGPVDHDQAEIVELVEAAVAAAGDPCYTVPSARPAHRVWFVDTPRLPPARRPRVA